MQVEPGAPATMHVASLHEAAGTGYWAIGSLRAALLAPDGTVRRLDIAGDGVVEGSPDGTLLGWSGPGRPCALARYGLEGPRWSASLSATCEAARPASDGGAWALVRGNGASLPERLVRWSANGERTLDLGASTFGGRAFARSISPAPDGAVVVVLYGESPDAAQLIRVSVTGEPTWRSDVSVSAGGNVATGRLLAHPDGGYLLDAYAELPGDVDLSELQAFDESGRFQWRYALGSMQQERPLKGLFAIPGAGWGVVAHRGAPGEPDARWAGRLARDGTPGAWQRLGEQESCDWIDDVPRCFFAVDGQGTLLVATTTGTQQRVLRLGTTEARPDAMPPAGGWAPILGMAATGDGGIVVLDAPPNGERRMSALVPAGAAAPRTSPVIEDAGSRGILDVAWSAAGDAWLLSAGVASARTRLSAYPPAGARSWAVELSGPDEPPSSTVGAIAASSDRVCAIRHLAPPNLPPMLRASCHARDDGRALWTREFEGFIRSAVLLRAMVDPVDGALVFGAQLRFDAGGSRVHLFRLDGVTGATVADTLGPIAPRSALAMAPDRIVIANSATNQPTRFIVHGRDLRLVREVSAADDRPVDDLLLAGGERILALGRPWDAFDGRVLSGTDLAAGTGWRTALPQLGRDARLAAQGDRAWVFGAAGPWDGVSLLTIQFDPRNGAENWRREEPIGARLAESDAIGVVPSGDGRQVYAVHSGLGLPLRLRVFDAAGGAQVYGLEAPLGGVRSPRVSLAVASDGALRALVATELPGWRERPALLRLDAPGQVPLLRDGFEPAAP